jgi:uncharacterized membrane protein YkvA (DUF1232 family)
MTQVRQDMRRAPRRDRIIATACLVYLASPIDLIPDFIPVIGHADDAVVLAYFLRTVGKHRSAAGKLATELKKLTKARTRKS